MIQLSMAIKLPDIDQQIRQLGNLAQFWKYDFCGWQYLQYSQSLKTSRLSAEIKLLQEENIRLKGDLKIIYNHWLWRCLKHTKRQVKRVTRLIKSTLTAPRIVEVLLSKYKIRSEDLLGDTYDFVILKKETEKWQANGFERVGKDWHIKITRRSDGKTFLLDQPLFYALQILGERNMATELFITYGMEELHAKNCAKVLRKLELC